MHKHNIYQTNTHETHMEEGFSLLSIMKKFILQPNAWDKDSSATKWFWVPLLQRLLYKLHQHNFALQVYVINTLPKACIYMEEIRQFSKVGEVVAVKEIKLNELTNLPLACVLCFNVKRHIRGYVVEQPVNDSWLIIRATHEYIDSRLVSTGTRKWLASCRKGESRIQVNIVKWQSNQLDGGRMYYAIIQSIVFWANLYP